MRVSSLSLHKYLSAKNRSSGRFKQVFQKKIESRHAEVYIYRNFLTDMENLDEEDLAAAVQWMAGRYMNAEPANPETAAIPNWEIYMDLAESGDDDSIIRCVSHLTQDLKIVRAFDVCFDHVPMQYDSGIKEEVADRFKLVVREMEEKGCISKDDCIRWVQLLHIHVEESDTETEF
jgi:hypothetical protein